MEALGEGKTDRALEALREAEKADIDIELYLTLVLESLRAVLLLRHAPELAKDIAAELGPDEYKEIETLARAKDSHITHATLLAFLDAASRMRFSPIPVLALELAVLSETA
jgi:hypothetical protein